MCIRGWVLETSLQTKKSDLYPLSQDKKKILSCSFTLGPAGLDLDVKVMSLWKLTFSYIKKLIDSMHVEIYYKEVEREQRSYILAQARGGRGHLLLKSFSILVLWTVSR